MRLNRATLERLPPAVQRPAQRGPIGVGIVHLGPGAFHRAHQAAYIDTLLDHDPRWGIAAVALRSRGIVDVLAAQDGLYTLAIRDAMPAWRVLDAHRAWLGPDDGAATMRVLARPETALVTTTVTEKGYCLAPDGTLDFNHRDIVHDLAAPARPISAIGWIVAGLAARRAAGDAPFVVMPCDNLPGNGAAVRAALIALARARDGSLADWIAGEVRVATTMVDAITPASDAALIAATATVLGVDDAIPVQREAFAQWVIEDIGAFGPDLAAGGAIVTGDVGAYERAKLRILNGSHSTLAYVGLLRGHASVARAMADRALAGFVATMIAAEIAPSLPPAPGLDLADYAAAVLDRFRNSVLVHRLEQIAWDGSQKLPYRLLDTLAARRRAGAPPGRVAAAAGAWVAFLMQRARAGVPLVDPAAATLTGAAADGDGAIVVARLAAAGLLPLPDDLTGRAVAAAADAASGGDWPQFFARAAEAACS
ncbi:mannitol dehydrogenase family protein [Sphingomonas sp.]|uniref:mannitol dehydrogenase family protein n=1 Tax=Sphingomonas sp. TaxID=28214 RepID=UPI003CC5CC84